MGLEYRGNRFQSEKEERQDDDVKLGQEDHVKGTKTGKWYGFRVRDGYAVIDK